ncbi:hypothetical protein HYT23_02175 [Candidatus Pacearchaeota archaeon]|nr:hypothetical protein [Candidatus Pacearchaeota archaeon]
MKLIKLLCGKRKEISPEELAKEAEEQRENMENRELYYLARDARGPFKSRIGRTSHIDIYENPKMIDGKRYVLTHEVLPNEEGVTDMVYFQGSDFKVVMSVFSEGSVYISHCVGNKTTKELKKLLQEMGK